MTEENEPPVHYQLSVTGRQAAGFFLGLLVCLGLAFFFGMKTGAAAHRGPGPSHEPAADAAEGAGRPVPEATEPPLGIEAPRAAARPEREEAPAARPSPPPKEAEEAVRREEKAAERTEKPAEKSGEKAVGKAAEKAAEKPAEKAAARTARPEVTEVTEVTKVTKAAEAHKAVKPAEKAEAGGPFWVQVFVTKSAEKADAFTKKLKKDGFSADVTPVPGKAGLFRVRVGPYHDRAKAEAAAARVQKSEQLKEAPRVTQ